MASIRRKREKVRRCLALAGGTFSVLAGRWKKKREAERAEEQEGSGEWSERKKIYDDRE